MGPMKRFLPALLCVTFCATAIFFWFKHYQTPLVREHAESPLYTVKPAESANLLVQGKTVRAWGPLPGSAFYPGTLAFASPDEAKEWLHESGKAEKGWRVYELSGDFNLDTHFVRGLCFTNKTLLVAHEYPTLPK